MTTERRLHIEPENKGDVWARYCGGSEVLSDGPFGRWRGKVRLRRLLLLGGLLFVMQYPWQSPAWSENLLRFNNAGLSDGDNEKSGDVAVMPGDVLKIQFFSELNLNGPNTDGEAKNVDAPGSFYERSDLSGEFEVDEKGELSHPFLGVVAAKGAQLSELEETLRKTYASKTGSSITDRVTFVRRSPIYLLGLVSHPGAYQYIRGMTVAQVIALASGIYRPDRQSAQAGDVGVENVRFNKNQKMLRLLHLRRARLLSELENKPVVEPTPELIRLVGKAAAEKLVDRENRFYQRVRKIEQQQAEQLNEEKALIDEEMKALANRKQNLFGQLGVVEKRLLRYRDLYKTSSVGNSIRANKELASFELQHLTLQNDQSKLDREILDAKHRKLKVEQSLFALRTADIPRLKQEMDDIETQLVETQGNVDLARGTLSKIERDISEEKIEDKTSGQGKIIFEITRREGDRFRTFTVDDNFYLKPGDVVRIKFGTGAS